MLSYSIEAAGLQLVPVQDVLNIALDQRCWHEAHGGFQAVRHLSLQTKPSTICMALLLVAEQVAKVTYNASGRSAPFDESSGARLVKKFGEFVAICAGTSEQEAWELLSSPTWRRNPG